MKISFYYLWMESDAAGVWIVDEDQFKLDNGFNLPLEKLKKQLSKYIDFDAEERLLIKDFLWVNQCDLKKLNPDYNPHKPVFRAIAKNNLKLDLSLNQACFKLVVEVEVEDEVVVEEEVEVEKNKGQKKEESDFEILDPLAFEVFWDLYDYKVNKPKCLEKWGKLNQSEKQKCINYLPEYVKRTYKDDTFPNRKHPLTFLNNQSWEDELPKAKLKINDEEYRKKRKQELEDFYRKKAATKFANQG